jgi:hypothetical protein
MAKKTIQCSQAGCTNTFSFDDSLEDDEAAQHAEGWSKVNGAWLGCASPGSGCPMVPPAEPAPPPPPPPPPPPEPTPPAILPKKKRR